MLLLSGNSPTLNIASAHARLDGIEIAVLSIQTMLTNMNHTSTDNTQPVKASSGTVPTPQWPFIILTKHSSPMSGIQLFDGWREQHCCSLSLLNTPVKKNDKRHKPTVSPDSHPPTCAFNTTTPWAQTERDHFDLWCPRSGSGVIVPTSGNNASRHSYCWP